MSLRMASWFLKSLSRSSLFNSSIYLVVSLLFDYHSVRWKNWMTRLLSAIYYVYRNNTSKSSSIPFQALSGSESVIFLGFSSTLFRELHADLCGKLKPKLHLRDLLMLFLMLMLSHRIRKVQQQQIEVLISTTDLMRKRL